MQTGKLDHHPIDNRPDYHPFEGSDAVRHPVDERGFEAIAGYNVRKRRQTEEGRLRAVSELTFGPSERVARGHPEELASAGVQVRVPDTTQFPFRANAALLIQVPGYSEPFAATGWFAGPSAVITAGHAVYPRINGGYTGWASKIEVVPGMNGLTGPKPFGSSVSMRFSCPQGWSITGDQRLDYGVVLLNQPLGKTVGWFGFASYSDPEILSSVGNLAGYPVVPPDPSAPNGLQWYAAGSISNVDEFFVYYDLATLDGESGSCVYRIIGTGPYAMAIHTMLIGGTDRAVRISQDVLQNIQRWSQATDSQNNTSGSENP
jgi:glutamyl endopeptidase